MAIKKFKESDEDEQVRKTALREVRILKVRACPLPLPRARAAAMARPPPPPLRLCRRVMVTLHPPLCAPLVVPPAATTSAAFCPCSARPRPRR